MSEARLTAIMDNFDAGIDKYIRVGEMLVSDIEQDLDQCIKRFQVNSDYLIGSDTVTLIRYTESLQLTAYYYTLSIYMPYSPDLLAILAALWTAIKWVWKAIKWIADLLETLHVLDIHQMLYSLWPNYRAWVDEMFGKLSELSGYLGWGVDGIMHLVQSIQSGKNVVGGLLGKSDSWLQIEWTEKALDAGQYIASAAKLLQQDPGKIMDLIFTLKSKEVKWEVGDWWDKTSGLIQKGTDIAQTALNGTVSVINELQMIQNNMPQVVRENIPDWIWNSLEKADSLIYDRILPGLANVDKHIDQLNAIIGSHRTDALALADKLARPGDVLQGVDELDEYIRLTQEAMIDDVSSREFQRTADTNRLAMQTDLDDFDRIDELMSVPTPEPSMLTLEDVRWKQFRGIIVEPHESWFVGDY